MALQEEALNRAVPLIKRFEGCKLKAYVDEAGKVTIGWGSTGPGIVLGVEWGQAEADERLISDSRQVLERITALIKVSVNPNQLAALIDFSYNLGVHNLARSGLLRLLNLSKYKDAADQFILWNHIGLYVSPGLTERRQVERELFLEKK